MASPSTGALRIQREVAIDRMEQNDLVAISQTPAVVGEEMTLDLFSADRCVELSVKVLESRPVVVQGSLRHQLRLSITTRGVEVEPSTGRVVTDVASNGSELA